jgi:hypothetical protein
MEKYKRINNLTGFAIFIFATAIYWLCMEPTVSFWDCGEFIAAAFKMEVGHQPGAPLFLMIGKLFSLLAGSDVSKVPYWINFLSVISSGATIMFLFWTINAIAIKLIKIDNRTLTNIQLFSVIAAGTVGALAYTFSDTFWFSAVEAEVYAISTLCTAIVFWAALKWENQMDDKWLLFIAFMIGLSIGMHLLSLLIIPSISLLYYFKKTKEATFWGAVKAFTVGCLILGVVQIGVIQYLVLFAAKIDIWSVNSLKMGFGNGALVFLAVVVASLAFGVHYSIKKGLYRLNLALLSTVLILFGFSSYFMIIIRANAKPNINLSSPDTPMSLYGYLSRTQYEEKPLLYGQFFDSKPVDVKEKGTSYRREANSYEVSGKQYSYVYDKNTIFPRTYSNKPNHIKFYQSWLGLSSDQSPNFWQNLSFFNSYQLGFMYWRYFLWNFSGRQNDTQGHGSITEGNWITGIKPLDAVRLGNQSHLPPSIIENAGRNSFYGLPLLLGILGLIYLYKKDKKVTAVLASLFFFTGIAIIFYINQDPLQVRERDYAYVGSFYVFAIFIGISVFAFKSYLQKILAGKTSLIVATTLTLLAAPLLMALQGWNDHDRSGKTTALEMAKNYLNSCEPNAILFTNADNDTYPLWYAQEVEGIRTDVRVVNLQFLSTASYIDQMKRKQYKSEALPISIDKEKYKDGVRDYLSYIDYGLQDSVELKDLLAILTSDHNDDKIQMNDGSFENFLPSQNLKLTVNADDVIAAKMLPNDKRHLVTDKLEWKFDKNHIFKGELVMLDIIANNKWKRPIYFSTNVSEDTYIGLDKYLYQEGFAYRLLPLANKVDERVDKSERTNNELAYQHYQQFELDGFKKAAYLDPESRRVLHATWAFANTLSANLIQSNQTKQAEKVIKISLDKLPLKNSSISDTLNKISLAQNLYALKNYQQANRIIEDTTHFIDKEMEYLLSLDNVKRNEMIFDVRQGLYVLQAFSELAKIYQQQDLSNQLKRRVENLGTRFSKA